MTSPSGRYLWLARGYDDLLYRLHPLGYGAKWGKIPNHLYFVATYIEQIMHIENIVQSVLSLRQNQRTLK